MGAIKAGEKAVSDTVSMVWSLTASRETPIYHAFVLIPSCFSIPLLGA